MCRHLVDIFVFVGYKCQDGMIRFVKRDKFVLIRFIKCDELDLIRFIRCDELDLIRFIKCDTILAEQRSIWYVKHIKRSWTGIKRLAESL